MPLFVHELNKILRLRSLTLTLLALLLLNGVLAFWWSDKSAQSRSLDWNEGEGFYSYYTLHSKEVDDYYAELLAYRAEQRAAGREAGGMQNVLGEERRAKYADGSYAADIALIETLYKDLEWVNSFKDETGIFLRNTEINYNEYLYQGYEFDSYECKYQLRVQKLYADVRDNVRLKFGYVRGWEDYYSFGITGILLLCITAIVASFAFARDKDVGVLPIIRVSKQGRGRTAAAKLLAVCTITVFLSLIMTLENLAIFGLTQGFSDAGCAIQILPGLRRSWLILSLGQYFWLHLGLRTLGALLFALPISLLSIVFYNHVLTYASSLALLGLNFWMYSAGAPNRAGILSHFNTISLTGGTRPVERYFGVNLFSAVCGRFTFIIVVSVLLCLISSAGAIILYCRGGAGFKPKWLSVALDKLSSFAPKSKRRRRKQKLRVLSLSLARTEGYKLLFATRFCIVVLLILIIRGYALYKSPEIAEAHGYSDTLYETYVTQVEGEWSAEKEAQLEQLCAEQAEIISIYDDMRQKKNNEEISMDEYLAYIKKYNHAPARYDVLLDLLTHSAYLRGDSENNEARGWFLYETGWSVLFDSGPDYFLYAVLLIILTVIFSQEYGRQCFAKILRSTKRGRRSVFFSKLGMVSLITVVLSLICQSEDIFAVSRIYRLPAHGAPLSSIKEFSQVGVGLTVGGFLLLLVLLKMLAALALALLIFSFSEFMRRSIPVMAATAALTLLPAVMAHFGIKFIEKVNYLNFLSGKPLFVASAGADWFGSDFGLVFICLVLIFAALSSLCAAAWAHYTK